MEEQQDHDDSFDPVAAHSFSNTQTDDLKYVIVKTISSRYVKKFKAHMKEYKLIFKNDSLPPLTNTNIKVDVITYSLNEMVRYVKKETNFETGDKINIIILNPIFFNNISTGVNCDDPVKKLKEKVAQILTSDESIDILDCTFYIQVVNMPHGAGRHRIINLEKDKRTKRCIVQIRNTNDNLCCPRAIVVGLSYVSNTVLGQTLNAAEVRSLRKGKRVQHELTSKLCNMLGEYNREGFTLEDIRNVEKLLGIQITVICTESLNTVIYKGESECNVQIYLYKTGNHFDLITKMNAFFGTVYYCKRCDTPYQNKNRVHRCKNKKQPCQLCMKEAHDPSTKNKIYCEECNRYCYNAECFTEHEFSVCFVVYKCKVCAKICLRENEHRCGFELCLNCGLVVEMATHKCYMLREPAKGRRCYYGCYKCAPPRIFTIEVEDDKEIVREHKCVVKSVPNIAEMVKSNFRNLVLKNHPDKGGSHEAMVELNNAHTDVQELLYNTSPLSCQTFHENEDKFRILGVTCNYDGHKVARKRQIQIEVPLKENPKCKYTEKYIFFDYECMQESGTHIPNLVVAHNFKGDKYVFHSNNEFCAWLISPEHQGYTAIAHYAKGYDSQFIMQYCITNTIKPYTIYNGTKLMLLEVCSIRLKIIDSFNFISFPLATFPKTFGLTELKKGYFPHYFNTLENENYVGPIPDKKYYSVDTMKPAARTEFLVWYNEKVEENYVFDLKKELLEYCDSDVDILRRSCLKFREEFLEIANIDPFQYITLPSVCMAIFRSKYLKYDTIGVFNEDLKDQYSKASIQWLMSQKNENIEHALNTGEAQICGDKVDGFDLQTNTVYQFHGCFWHGCPKCYTDGETINTVNKEKMEDLLEKTTERSKQIKDGGYNLVEIWECEWKASPLYKEYKTFNIVEPLNPRDAYFGGRTEVIKLKAESTSDCKIKYIDVCSLYPAVMFYDDYTIDHPTKIFQPKVYDKNWFGLIKCKILPPQDLYIPVLPVKIKMEKSEKLVFALCRTCAETQQSCKCEHSEGERVFVGTWTTVEVSTAIKKGYIILEIYEVWYFKASRDIFKSYIKDFMKIKLETSPHNYPSNEAYAKDVEERQGFKLDLDKIKPNPVKRTIAKLAMNSLYGKFGQRANMSQTEFVTDPSRFYELLLDSRLEDVNLSYISEEMIQVTYKFKEYYVKNDYNTNIFIALFTTANARLRLYEKISELGEAVIYMDTDSIMYYDDGKNSVQTGDLLGEWTDELGGGYIQKMLATGPKSYYYKTDKNEECTKIKGFTLHFANAENLNAETMEKLIDGEIENVKVTNQQITRDKTTKQLVNKDETKTFSFNFDKRIILKNYDTIPYGYCGCCCCCCCQESRVSECVERKAKPYTS